MGKASHAFIELVLTIVPWPRSSMCRPTTWEQRNTPVSSRVGTARASVSAANANASARVAPGGTRRWNGEPSTSTVPSGRRWCSSSFGAGSGGAPGIGS